MNLDKLIVYLQKNQQPVFRIKQIKEAFFKQSLAGFEQISTLNKYLRQDLAVRFPWLLVKPIKIQKDKGVFKALLKLQDGLKIESVLMFYHQWVSACLSVMVGCPLGCAFCATGKMGFKRNLTAFEIVDQIVFWNQYLKAKGQYVSRIVFMGMGEPFLNWDETWKAIQTIKSKDCLNIGQRHISVSTAGIIPGIEQFTDLDTQINLAISLHSPFQSQREKIMPIAKKYPLDQLFAAAEKYVDKSKRKLFFEYALIDGFNDRKEDATELKKIFTSPLFHLNLIQLNKIKTKIKNGLTPSNNSEEFQKELKRFHLPFTVRRSLGSNINAACGQLAGK